MKTEYHKGPLWWLCPWRNTLWLWKELNRVSELLDEQTRRAEKAEREEKRYRGLNDDTREELLGTFFFGEPNDFPLSSVQLVGQAFSRFKLAKQSRDEWKARAEKAEAEAKQYREAGEALAKVFERQGEERRKLDVEVTYSHIALNNHRYATEDETTLVDRCNSIVREIAEENERFREAELRLVYQKARAEKAEAKLAKLSAKAKPAKPTKKQAKAIKDILTKTPPVNWNGLIENKTAGGNGKLKKLQAKVYAAMNKPSKKKGGRRG